MTLNFDKRYLWLLLLAVVAGVSVWLQREAGPEQQNVTGGAEVPDYYLEGFVAKTMDAGGRLNQQLEARSMEHFASENVAELESPLFTNFRPDGHVWRIKSETAKAYPDKDLLFLQGGVVITRPPFEGAGPVKIDTSDLWVYQETEVAETSESVEIRDETGVTQGEGMKANMKEGRLQLLSAVKGEYAAKRVNHE